MKNRIGFMQGRLSPLVDGKIQAFPWTHWREEFPIAFSLPITKMEWTLDQENLYDNPFMTESGQNEIKKLSKQFELEVPSLTGDCFMQAPFFKKGFDSAALLKDFENIVAACGAVGTKYVIFPLVDNSSVKTEGEEQILIDELTKRTVLYNKHHVQIVFESDFEPHRLQKFISRFPKEFFGINYDSGNSASLGFDPKDEIPAYGERIYNVHIKDRILGGTTVPLGTGHVNFEAVFSGLASFNYNGNYILQTARAPEGQHEDYILKFMDFVEKRASL